MAQAATTVPTPVTLSSLVQAADGNFYAATAPTYACDGFVFFHGTGNCGAIYQITPAGVVSVVHTFANDASEGFDPNPLVIGPDGNLYGTTQGGGLLSCSTRGCGTFFKITTTGTNGTFSTVHFFTDAETGSANITEPVLGEDGYFYAPTFRVVNKSAIYKISTTGSFQLLSYFPDDIGFPTNKLVQGGDHNFYGSTSSESVDGGYIFRMTPSGVISTVYALPTDDSQGYNPSGLTQGPDGNLYGWTQGSPNHAPYAPASAFKVSTSGSFQTLYTTSAANTFVVSTPPLFSSDGNLYVSAGLGGDLSTCAAYFGSNHNGCGAVLQVTPAGTFKVAQTFVEGDKGQFPSAPVQGSNGKIVVSASHYEKNATGPVPGVVSSLDLNLPAPVQLSFTDANGSPVTGSIQPNVPLTLGYKVPGAYSLTASQCYASVQGNLAAAGTWTGKQSGITDATGFHGSAQVTPTADGTYTYALTCGGTMSGFVTLNLSSKLQITTSSLPDGSVGKSYSNLTLIDGGSAPYKYVADGLPPGVAIDPASGLLAGKPTQFGTYQVTIAVQDSSSPALTAGRVLPLTIDKSLMLSGSLKNATVGTQYTGGFSATGGYNAYKWTVSAGALPEGLTLNPTTGVISGKPTKAEQATFSITVIDGENPVDTVTLATALSTVAPPLVVTEGDFEACSVGVLCEGQFDATGGMPPYTWTVAPGATFPAGMTISANGEYSFKPIQYYDLPFQIEVQVTDSSKLALTATGIDTLKITSSLKANPYTLPVATVGQAYAAPAPVVTGGLPPYTWLVIGSDPSVKGEYGAKADGSLYSPGPKTAGTYTITYIVKDSEKNQATVQFSVPFTVMAPLTPTTTTSLSTSNSTAGTGMNVVLTANVAQSAGVPTGKVTFYNGTAVLGVASLDATGAASLTTSFSVSGIYSLTAQYSGDAAFGGSVSSAITETVVTPAITAAANPGTLTVTSGKSGTLAISVSGTGGYNGTVAFTCGTLPAHVTCSFAPSSITLSSTVTNGSSTLTVSTGPTATALSTRPGLPGRRAPLELAGLLGLTLLCTSRRTRLRLLQLSPMALLLIAFATMTALGLSGCGTASPNASPGTYAVPVNVVVGNATVQSVTVSVVVTQQ